MGQIIAWHKKTCLILSIIMGFILLSGCVCATNKVFHKSSSPPLNIVSAQEKIRQHPEEKVKTALQDSTKRRSPLLWDEGMQTLLLQALKPLPLEKKHRIRLGDFRMEDKGSRFALSRRIETTLRTTLNNTEDISLVGASTRGSKQPKTAEYLLSGLYRLEANRLRIIATLRESDSGRIISSSHVFILMESLVMEKEGEQSKPTKSRSLSGYDRIIERLLFSEPKQSSFELEVWTDKPVYQIGEAVTFYFRSSRNAYLTLLDVGTSGNLRILFPNRFQQEHRVTAGRVYAVPSKGAPFRIEANGPPGLERVKGIATSRPLTLVEGKPSSGFLTVSREHRPFQGDLKRRLDQLKDRSWAEGSAEIYITEDGKPPRLPGRFRTIKPKKPEKPIDITGTPGLAEEEKKKDPLDLSPKKLEKPIDTVGAAGKIPQQEMHHGHE